MNTQDTETDESFNLKLVAIFSNYKALATMGDLRDNIKFVMKAVAHHPQSIQFASSRLRTCIEFKSVGKGYFNYESVEEIRSFASEFEDRDDCLFGQYADMYIDGVYKMLFDHELDEEDEERCILAMQLCAVSKDKTTIKYLLNPTKFLQSVVVK